MKKQNLECGMKSNNMLTWSSIQAESYFGFS